MGKHYTEKQIRFCRMNCHFTVSVLTAVFNREFDTNKGDRSIRALCRKHGIVTRAAPNGGRFVKGNRPPNKGTKGLTGRNSTTFKKGNKPANSCPVGEIRKTTKDEYLKVKVAEPNEWEFLHLKNWREHHGEVPEGHVIAFIDGDRNDPSIENLECITRGELTRRNKLMLSSQPKELQPILKTVAKIQDAAGKLRSRS